MTPGPTTPPLGRTRLIVAGLGILVCLLALPVVIAFDGPVGGWALGLGLWLVNLTMQLVVGLVAHNAESPVMAVGLSGITSMGRAFFTFLVLMLVGLKVSEPAALTAGGVFLAAFTVDLMGRTITFQVGKTRRGTGEEGAE